MSVMHKPITRAQQIEGIARSLAQTPTRGERAARAQRIKKHHGQAMTQEIVDRAREILKEQRGDHA